MNFKNFYTSKNDCDRRLDKVIRKFLNENSLSNIYKSIRKGIIKVNSKKTSENYKIQENDIINIADFLLKTDENKPEQKNQNHLYKNFPKIVFENENILILDKPYDVLVHGVENSLEKLVKNYYKNNKNDDSLSFLPGPLHRLDRKTTGLISFSMSLEGARWFSENIKNHSIKKYYATVVLGKLEKTEIWEDFIEKNNETKNNFQTVKISNIKNENSKKAKTTISPIAYGKFEKKDVTLVKLEIHTGRTHQIRSQCNLHSHPILGDFSYGKTKLLGYNQDFFLQAYCLKIPKNPIGLPSEIKISLNSEFIKFLNDCGIENYGL